MTRIYTRDMNAITSLVEHARQQYLEISRPNVVVHTVDQVSTPREWRFRSIYANHFQELTFFSSTPLVQHLTGAAPRIKFVDLSAQSFYQKVSSTLSFVMHVNFWIRRIGMPKLEFRIVEDIFFMDLLELAKVRFLFSFFLPMLFNRKINLPRFDHICSRQYFYIWVSISSIKFLFVIGWWTRSWDILFVSCIWIVCASFHS